MNWTPTSHSSGCLSIKERSDAQAPASGLTRFGTRRGPIHIWTLTARGRDAEGFFDADAGDELLRGITMADCGNVTVNPSDVVHNFERLAGVVARIAERGGAARNPGR